MEYIVPSILTFAVVVAIILYIKKFEKISFNNISVSQSDIHKIIKMFLPEPEIKTNKSQMQKYLDKKSIRVIVVDGVAYWVADSIFYAADLKNKSPDFENARPVDTINMSQEEIDKMMFILDNLNRGSSDDSGSSRH